ncbi:reverse transcriptase domain-containing protein [Tanacetum coccineum]
MYHDNIQEYVSQAAAANFNQANSGYRPPMVSNQIRPPGFPPVQNPHANNQNNFNRGNNFNQNRGNNFNQGQIYRPPVNQPVAHQPVAHQGPAPQTHASTSGSGTLPGNTVTNPKEDLKDLSSFEISFTDALMLMPKFASTLKTLIGNKEKLSELARTPLNENCSAVILNKLPKKLGDPGRFLIPCEFTGITTCNALADLGASINLMPYSVWKDLALPELTPTCMTYKIIARGAREDVFPSEFDVIVGKGFHFINNNKNVLQVLIMSLIIDGEEVDATTKGKEVSKVNATELRRQLLRWDIIDDLKLRINEESNGEGSSGSDKCNAINIDDDNKEEEGANRGKTGVLQDNVVSLNLLSRTRKFGHSTMELRSLIS